MKMKRNSLSLFLWALVIILLISVTMSIFPTFIENQSRIFGMLNLIPKGVLQFKGFSDLNDLLSPMGFYSANNVIYMMVLGSIYAIVLASGILLKEEYNKTAEYLLTRPITRSEIFLTKLAVVAGNVFILNIIISLAGFIAVQLAGSDVIRIGPFMILSLYTFLLNIFFAATGLFISTLIKRSRPVTTFSIGLVLILYFIYTLSKISESVSKLGYLSPFMYVDQKVVSPDYSLAPGNLAYFMGISFLLIVISYRLYLHRDIYV